MTLLSFHDNVTLSIVGWVRSKNSIVNFPFSLLTKNIPYCSFQNIQPSWSNMLVQASLFIRDVLYLSVSVCLFLSQQDELWHEDLFLAHIVAR